MRLLSCLVVFVAGCATTSPSGQPAPTRAASGFPPEVEQVFIKATEDGPPPCEAGHEDRLVDGTVVIRPGETICVRLDVREGAVSPDAVVPARDENTLVLRVWQESGGTFLTLHNPLGSFLRYSAFLSRDGKTFEYTSSCPVLAGKLGIEQWPYAVSALRLLDFKLEPADDQMECR